jgi:hypothetical protein
MHRYSVLLMSLLALTALSGCRGGTNTVRASLGNEFSLAVGQAVELEGEQLTVQFEGVRDDSRCPKGATCIWQGRVTAVIRISSKGQSTELALTGPGLSDERGQADYGQYEITSRVEPYPELGRQIESRDYRLFLTVREQP